MKRLPKEEQLHIDPLAEQIWVEIICSMDHYTDDSAISKFLLPEEIIQQARPIAAAFAQLHFSPLPDIKEVYKSQLYGIFYLSIIFGMQVYLKERAITKEAVGFKIQQDPVIVRHIKNTAIKQLAEGVRVYTPVSQIIDLFTQYLLTPQRLEHITLGDYEFDREKFDKFMPVSLLWGYLFAKDMIID